MGRMDGKVDVFFSLVSFWSLVLVKCVSDHTWLIWECLVFSTLLQRTLDYATCKYDMLSINTRNMRRRADVPSAHSRLFMEDLPSNSATNNPNGSPPHSSQPSMALMGVADASPQKSLCQYLEGFPGRQGDLRRPGQHQSRTEGGSRARANPAGHQVGWRLPGLEPVDGGRKGVSPQSAGHGGAPRAGKVSGDVVAVLADGDCHQTGRFGWPGRAIAVPRGIPHGILPSPFLTQFWHPFHFFYWTGPGQTVLIDQLHQLATHFNRIRSGIMRGFVSFWGVVLGRALIACKNHQCRERERHPFDQHVEPCLKMKIYDGFGVLRWCFAGSEDCVEEEVDRTEEYEQREFTVTRFCFLLPLDHTLLFFLYRNCFLLL